MTRLKPAPAVAPRGVRVVVDARPVQEPERSPLTAWYLDRLLHAFAAEPLEGESFVLVSRALREDPAVALSAAGLPVAGSRRIPPTTRALRSAGLTLDSFLLRGAEVGTADDGGSSIFHTAGGAVPIASRLPIVATLLDLAPWELPAVYATTPAARFGHRLRARVLHDAALVIVCSRAVAETARRRLRIPAERLAIVPLAVDDEFQTAARDRTQLERDARHLALPPRYLSFIGRYDARKDMATLFRALALLRERGTASGNGRHGTLPALVIALEPDQEHERRSIEHGVAANGVAEMVSIVVVAGTRQRAAVLAASEALVYPALSEAAALSALEALATGVPVICSRVGALPEMVGSAGIVVEPRDPPRMAAALEAIWATGSLAQQLRRQAVKRADGPQRNWSDVARETRVAYASVAAAAPAEDRLRSALGRFALR